MNKIITRFTIVILKIGTVFAYFSFWNRNHK